MGSFCCSSCGNSSFYLKAKGNNVGQYCSICHTWKKWVGKKDVAAMKTRGIPVKPENWYPETHQPITNVGQIPYFENHPVNDPPFDVSHTDSAQSSASRVSRDIMDCSVCFTGELNRISPTDEVRFRVFEDLLIAYSADGTKRMGACKIKFCPECGQPVSKRS